MHTMEIGMTKQELMYLLFHAAACHVDARDTTTNFRDHMTEIIAIELPEDVGPLGENDQTILEELIFTEATGDLQITSGIISAIVAYARDN